MQVTEKTVFTEHDLTVDTAKLQSLLNCGRQSAVEIGVAAGARSCVGRRVLWNVSKVKDYLNQVSGE